MLANFSVEQSLMKAKSHLRNGEITEAQHLYETILKKFSNNIRAQQGLEAIQKVNQNTVTKCPPQEVVNQLVNLYNQRKMATVIEQTGAVIEQYPEEAILWNILGASKFQTRELEGAVGAYKKSISLNPNNADVYNNLGVALRDCGKFDEAVEAYRKSISLRPDYAEAYNNMGVALKDQNKLEEAIEAYNKSISLKPNYAEAYNNMGVALNKQGDLERAMDFYKKCISLQPVHAKGHFNMGNALRDQLKLDEAIEYYNKSILLKPNYYEAYNNMGVALKDQDKLEEAIEAFKKCISLKPKYAEAFNSLGICFQRQDKLDEAIEAYNACILLKPDYASAYYNSSFIYSLKGDLRKGLELYEWRLKKKDIKVRLPRNHLIWDGIESIKGKKFFVYEEQGLGDVIQFCRYLLLLKKKGAEVTFRVKKKMHAMLQTMDRNIILVENDPDDKEIDFEAPLMSLPYLFSTNLNTIPSSKSYLFANHDKVTSWKKRLTKTTFKIGVCWQGAILQSEVGRSFPLSLFEDISKLPNIELISLHKGEGEKQIKNINFGLTTFGNDFDAGKNSFEDTAAVMINCDLIISCDTSIAHLAGALGCPIWVALKKIPEWRWMLDRNDSPWYPNMRLYRQKDLGDWDHVFKIMKKDLVRLIK